MSSRSTPRSLAPLDSNADLAVPVTDLSAKSLGIRHLAAKNARMKAEQDKQLLAVSPAWRGEPARRITAIVSSCHRVACAPRPH